MKLLSVIIPEHRQNHKLLKSCIKSIEYQQEVDFNNIEVIVVKDGCNDDLSYLNSSLDLQIVNTNGKLGPGGARDYGLKFATGKFIYFMDSDDMMFTPLSLAYMVENLTKYPDAPMFDFTFINEHEGNILHYFDYASIYDVVFRADLIKKFDLHFINTDRYEDVAFVSSYTYLVGPENLQHCYQLPIYWYRANTNSVTNGNNDPVHIL